MGRRKKLGSLFEVTEAKPSVATKPFNPLDKGNLGESVAEALLERPVSPLPPEEFRGVGIYAIYYVGEYAAYGRIALANQGDKYAMPIYVGKAIPEGGRKGGLGFDVVPGTELYKRLREHAESIKQAPNLRIEDFKCRYLVVDDIWIPLGESLLIERFRPLWNRVVDGFGNHDPGSGRYNQQKSPWDLLHPGRSWAEKLRPHSREETEVLKIVDGFLTEIENREKK